MVGYIVHSSEPLSGDVYHMCNVTGGLPGITCFSLRRRCLMTWAWLSALNDWHYDRTVRVNLFLQLTVSPARCTLNSSRVNAMYSATMPGSYFHWKWEINLWHSVLWTLQCLYVTLQLTEAEVDHGTAVLSDVAVWCV